MSVEVRAKFTVQQVVKKSWGATISLVPQYDENLAEDQRFSEATPNGELWMDVSNPVVIEKMILGKTYYLDFVPAE